MEVATLDAIDRQIIHILTIEPRASFRAVAEVTGISDQTAARRYRRLSECAGLRVLGVIDGTSLGWVDWFLRLQTTPGSADSIADALARNGTLTPEQARQSPWRHVLYKFLGCAEMTDGPEVRPFTPEAGDRLVLASDGLTGHVTDEDFRACANRGAQPLEWADTLVRLALERGSRDNVTCVVVAFDAE